MNQYPRNIYFKGGGPPASSSPATPASPFSAAAMAARPVTDLAAYPILTEEVGFPPSPLARSGPASGAPGGTGGTGLGQIVSKAVNDVLGWKVKSGDTKGFLGALTQSFTLTEVEGRIESTWKPRTYAVQTDLSGGITGAQASVYSRGKIALDQCLPLLDGLYKLNPEAIDEDVAALKAVVKGQLSELVNELAFLGGPRVSRVDQYFGLLLGAAYPANPGPNVALPQTDPDLVGGTLGNLRDELGLNFKTQDFVNSVEDETDLSNYRIICDYVTSLAQSWLNNVGFVVLNTTTPFFGTQLVLLSRQLSVLAESVDEVRFTLDSVFIGPSERQTMQLNFNPASGLQPIFLEDLLSWIHDFATEEGPRLIQDGGKFGVQNTFYPLATKLLNIINLVPNIPGMPPGFYTSRVTLALNDLSDQLLDMANLAKPVEHTITPAPDFGLPLTVAVLQPNSVSLIANPPVTGLSQVTVYVRGSGFQFAPGALPTVQLQGGPAPFSTLNPVASYFRSESLLVAVFNFSPLASGPITGIWNVAVANPGGSGSFVLNSAFTVTP